MTDIPDNVDLNWLARHLIDFRDETRTELSSFSRDLAGVRDELQGVREQVGVAIAGLLRVERNLCGELGRGGWSTLISLFRDFCHENRRGSGEN